MCGNQGGELATSTSRPPPRTRACRPLLTMKVALFTSVRAKPCLGLAYSQERRTRMPWNSSRMKSLPRYSGWMRPSGRLGMPVITVTSRALLAPAQRHLGDPRGACTHLGRKLLDQVPDVERSRSRHSSIRQFHSEAGVRTRTAASRLVSRFFPEQAVRSPRGTCSRTRFFPRPRCHSEVGAGSIHPVTKGAGRRIWSPECTVPPVHGLLRRTGGLVPGGDQILRSRRKCLRPFRFRAGAPSE